MTDGTSGRRLSGGLLVLLAVVVAGLVGLGVWQVKRLGWKRALIQQVERRLAAAPVAAPGHAQWPRIDRTATYTRVTVRGRYRHDAETFVQATTELGGGFWLMTPLLTDQGFTVLINRGFVPPDRRAPDRHADPTGAVTVTGLLRITEPGGGFLRRNAPEAGRWYSRDIAAIARTRQLADVAPYFIDADAVPGQSWPRGGMTVVRFPNNHLMYALTWFTMAGLLAIVTVRLVRRRQGD